MFRTGQATLAASWSMLLCFYYKPICLCRQDSEIFGLELHKQNWQTGWLPSLLEQRRRKKELLVSLKSLTGFLCRYFFQSTVAHWHWKMQQQQPRWWNCQCYNRREIKWSICWSGCTRKWLRHHMTQDAHSVPKGSIYLEARLLPDSTKGGLGLSFEVPDPFAVGSCYIDSKYLPHPWVGRQTVCQTGLAQSH